VSIADAKKKNTILNREEEEYNSQSTREPNSNKSLYFENERFQPVWLADLE
jgi:hypothetical protein